MSNFIIINFIRPSTIMQFIVSLLSTPLFVVTAITLGILAWIRFIKTGPVYKGEKRLDGKTVLITGGNCGIGKATAIELAKRKARVIIACRNVERSNEAVTDIKIKSGNESVIFMKLDLSDFDDVRRFATEFSNTEPQLDILVNNAGAVIAGMAKNGLNLMLATNHLGVFLLTNLLMPLLRKTAKSNPVRIVNVSSEGYKMGAIDLNDLSPHVTDDSTIGMMRQYGRTKLMNIYFTTELNKRLRAGDAECKNITTYCLHPGSIDSKFGEAQASRKSFMPLVRRVLMMLGARSVYYGCQTTLYCCLEDGIEDKSGQYFANLRTNKLWRHACDPEIGEKLWEKSEELTGLA